MQNGLGAKCPGVWSNRRTVHGSTVPSWKRPRQKQGGTRGFDAAKSNAELEKILEEKRGDNNGQNGDSEEEEETPGKDKGSVQHLNTHF